MASLKWNGHPWSVLLVFSGGGPCGGCDRQGYHSGAGRANTQATHLMRLGHPLASTPRQLSTEWHEPVHDTHVPVVVLCVTGAGAVPPGEELREELGRRAAQAQGGGDEEEGGEAGGGEEEVRTVVGGRRQRRTMLGDAHGMSKLGVDVDRHAAEDDTCLPACVLTSRKEQEEKDKAMAEVSGGHYGPHRQGHGLVWLTSLDVGAGCACQAGAVVRRSVVMEVTPEVEERLQKLAKLEEMEKQLKVRGGKRRSRTWG